MTETFQPTPKKEIKGRINRKLASIGLAGTVLFGAGAAGCDLFPGFAQSVPTPTPSGDIGNINPTPTFEITPTPTSTPEATPTPTIEPTPSPTPMETLSPEEKLLTPHLADVGKKAGINKIGVEFTGNDYQRADWAKMTTEQFNYVTLDWGLDWTDVEPSKGNFNFSIIDRQLPFIKAHDLAVRGAIVDVAQSTPPWIEAGNYSKAELKEILINHVKTLVSHYKDVIKEWVVVNEPYIKPFRTDDIFYKALGYNYIDIAFQAAREADPSAKLIYNDTENHRTDSGGLTTELTQKNVKRLKSKGLIDMVGLEMHVDGSFHTSKQDMINTMKSYGVPVAITEFDIDLNTVKGTPTQRLALQAKLAGDVIGACRESKVCKEITFWGIGDRDSWLEVFMGEKNADATMFDDNLKPKPFYFSVRKALS